MSNTANRLIQAAAGAGGEQPDEHFGDVVLLLDGDGTSGDDNLTYSDESSNARSVTAVNNPRQGSFSPYGSRWSTYYDGSSSHYYNGGSLYEANTTGFTVSFWANGLANSIQVFVAKGTLNNASNSSWWLETVSGTMRFYISNGSGYVICTDPASFESYGGWVHVAAVIDNGTAKLYMNGQLKDSQTVTTTNSTGTVPVYIGGYTTSYPFEGYISNVRIHQSALYSGTSFTVPTTVRRENATFWANFSNTGGYFVNHGGPTVYGTPRVVPYSPVTQYAITSDDEIDIADGGSVYFDGYDGTTDYLTFAASGYNNVTDFTISFWIYPENMANHGGGYPRAFASGAYTGSGNFIIYLRDDDIRLYFGGERIQTPLEKYKWTHISLQRSGGTFTMYKNGVSVGTSALSTAVRFDTTNSIGSEVGSWGMKGYIAGFRLTTNGSTPVTVPTGALTEVTDTQLLMNFKDAGIYDKSGMHNLYQTGAATEISTSTVKYGTGSIYTNGSGNRLQTQTFITPFRTEDFTVEAWVYFNSVAQDAIFSTRLSTGSTTTGFMFTAYAQQIQVYVNGAFRTPTSTVSSGQWYHVAWAREGNVSRMYLDGVYQGNYTDTHDYTSETFYVGGDINNSYSLNGFIDDLRVTRGLARYTGTGSFTPPARAHPSF
jgi:hypothetical protein